MESLLNQISQLEWLNVVVNSVQTIMPYLVTFLVLGFVSLKMFKGLGKGLKFIFKSLKKLFGWIKEKRAKKKRTLSLFEEESLDMTIIIEANPFTVFTFTSDSTIDYIYRT